MAVYVVLGLSPCPFDSTSTARCCSPCCFLLEINRLIDLTHFYKHGMTSLRFLRVRQQTCSFAMLCNRYSHWICQKPVARAFRSGSSWQRSQLDRRRKYSVVAAAVAAEKHFAVVGAGLAGLATAYHLLKLSAPGHSVHVTLIDAVGIGAGGSGAAAGLLHPFTPKGKLLWKAQEAMEAALDLLAAAEAAAALSPDIPDTIAWRTGMLRPASDIKQSQAYWRLCNKPQQQQQQQHEQGDSIRSPAENASLQSLLQASIADAVTASQLVPQLVLPGVQEAAAAAAGSTAQQQQQQTQPQRRRRNKQEQQQQQLEGWTAANSAALHIAGGITLHPLHYMTALWKACQLAAAARGDGSSARLQIQQLQTLDTLQTEITASRLETNSDLHRDDISGAGGKAQFDAIVVAAGAAVGSIAEFSDELPISLCQGYTLDMVRYEGTPASRGDSSRGSSSSSSNSGGGGGPSSGLCYAANSPSLLGSPYIASQGGEVLVVGATKQHNCTAQRAFNELGRTINPSILQQPRQQGGNDARAADVAAAAEELLTGAAAMWPPLALWAVGGIRTGVRALPPRTQHGSVPLAGRWHGDKQSSELTESTDSRAPVWLLVGLGARGLVYHAWLGQLTAQAVLSNSEDQLPAELLAWRNSKASSSTAAPIASIREAQ